MRLDIKKKISPKMVQEAYFLQVYDVDESKHKEKNDDLESKKQLPDEFYSVLGKILTFVEKVDEKSKID